MDKHPQIWHFQLINGSFSGNLQYSSTGDINRLILQFDAQKARDEDSAHLQHFKYKAAIRILFIHIHMHRGIPMGTQSAIKKWLFDGLPYKIIEKLCPIDITETSGAEIINTRTAVGRTVHHWDHISNKLTLRQENPCGPVRPDACDRTSNSLTLNQMGPVILMTGCNAYLPKGDDYHMSLTLVTCRLVYFPMDTCQPGLTITFLSIWNVGMYMHH
jgi:hypothetical protein